MGPITLELPALATPVPRRSRSQLQCPGQPAGGSQVVVVLVVVVVRVVVVVEVALVHG